MKNILIFIGGVLLMTSCIKDKTVYDFANHEEITVTGIEGSYTKISNIDHITLSPEVSSTDPDAEFEYMWGLYETSVQGAVPVLDTIGWTKDLDHLISRPAKAWVLVFRATNKNTGYAKYVTSTINVETAFTRGWYVAKTENGQTDVDLFLTPESIVPDGSKGENVFSTVNGRKLDGKAIQLTFFSAYKTNVVNPAQFANTRSLFVVSDADLSAVNIADFKEIRNFSTTYFLTPSVKEPRAVHIGPQSYYIINAGKSASIYNMSANTGQFGVAQEVNTSKPVYNLSRYFLSQFINGGPYFYDEISGSFYYSSIAASFFTAVNDHVDTDMSAKNTNKELLWMGLKVWNPMQGFALFRDKTDPSLKILSTVVPSTSAFRLTNDTLSTSEKLYNGERFAALDGDENLLYFTVDREVYSRNLSNRFEQLQFTVPAGEEITFIRHRKAPGNPAPYAYNYVMIGTKSGNNYKVRMFEKASGNLLATPAFILEGTGEVGDVIYIAPNISETTYINTY